MALEIKGMKRVFKMKKNSQEIHRPHPNAHMPPADALHSY